MPFDTTALNTIGQRYKGFTVLRAFDIPELKCTLRELKHDATGAQVLHLGNDDPENLFCLSFSTLPYNSNGVAHILEHTVLCGSKKYPVKDPFFGMTRRSLNTFMNALTGSDFTCYPAASQVPKDFYNILDVYLDAVFHPLLNELSFMQEGCRLEFASPTDPSTPLEYKGIVFNEMKGALSNPTTRLLEVVNTALFPNLPYGFDSGGDPKVIPELTYEQLCDFHRKYYHPSRCLFFFYGNMPLEGHLDFIAKQSLDNAERLPPLEPIPPQPRFTQPVYKQVHYPVSVDEETANKTVIALAWLTCHILEQQDLLALSVLEIALMDNDASPLKFALLKSGLCTQAGIYLEGEFSEVPAVLILKGCNANTSQELETLVRTTLQELVTKGIPKNLVENAIHQLEFFRSEITGDQNPFGLSLFMRSALLKQHQGAPEYGLMIHSLFDSLREQLAKNPKYLEGMLEKYFLNNPHFARIELIPDPTFALREKIEERHALDKIASALSEKRKKEIVEKTQELAEFQKKQHEEKVDILPKVTLSDVPKKARYYALEQQKLGNLELYSHHCFTNGIVYADLIFDWPDFAEEEVIYVRLFSLLLSQLGSGGRTYAETLEYIQGNTGGLGASLALNVQAKNHAHLKPCLFIKSKALDRKVDKLFPLLYDTCTSVDFTDIPRLKEILLKHYTGLESSLNQNALKYAINLSASGLNTPSKLANDMYGLPYFWKIRDLVQNFDVRIPHLIEILQNLQNRLLCLENANLVITCGEEMYSQLVKQNFYGLQNLPKKSFVPWKGNYPLVPVAPQGRIISSPIAFISKVFKTVSYDHPDAPALNLSAFLFDNLVLHNRVREQGGAYGGGATSNSVSGNLYLYSYRDPNIASTLEAFKDAVQTVVDEDFDEEDLEEAKLEIIQALDAPTAPGSRGETAYSWFREGRTQEMRQAYRERLLALTCEEVARVVATRIAPQFSEAVPIVFAGKELLEKENELLKQSGGQFLKFIEPI